MTSYNQRRARDGGQTLALYQHTADGATDDDKADITDIITNLMHYANSLDIDIRELVDMAFMHFEAENADSECNKTDDE